MDGLRAAEMADEMAGYSAVLTAAHSAAYWAGLMDDETVGRWVVPMVASMVVWTVER